MYFFRATEALRPKSHGLPQHQHGPGEDAECDPQNVSQAQRIGEILKTSFSFSILFF
jgi:hypothetical protein